METSSLPTPSRRPSLLGVVWRFGCLGAQAFGGLGAALAILEDDLVRRRGWVTSVDIRDALTFTKPLPGSTVVQVVTFVGWRLGGMPAAVLATIAFVAPAAVLMVAAAAATGAVPDTPATRGALLGLQVVVVGLLAATTARLLRSEAATPWLAVTAILAAAAGFVINAAVVVVAAGFAAVAVTLTRHRWRSPHG